jgi:hypothetical protein
LVSGVQVVSITYLQAQDEIYGMANVAWKAASIAAGLSYTPKLCFPDKVVPPPDVEQIYAEASFVVVTADQATLSRYQGASTYEETGLFALQVYSPKKGAASLRVAQTIAAAVRDAFCKPSTSGEIWFRKQKVTPVSGNETKNQVNVVVTCTYRTTK